MGIRFRLGFEKTDTKRSTPQRPPAKLPCDTFWRVYQRKRANHDGAALPDHAPSPVLARPRCRSMLLKAPRSLACRMHRFQTSNHGKDPGSFLPFMSWDPGPDLSPSPIPQGSGPSLVNNEQEGGPARTRVTESAMTNTRLECCVIATVLMLVLAAGVHAFAFP
jgi:hypothetical protein